MGSSLRDRRLAADCIRVIRGEKKFLKLTACYCSSWHVCVVRPIWSVCAWMCRGVLDCFCCCSELICEIELCLHTAAPAAWHPARVCCVVLDGSGHGEWKIREREKADGLPWGPRDRDRERGRGREEDRQEEKGREKCQLTLTYFVLPTFSPCASVSAPQWGPISQCYNAALSCSFMQHRRRFIHKDI